MISLRKIIYCWSIMTVLFSILLLNFSKSLYVVVPTILTVSLGVYVFRFLVRLSSPWKTPLLGCFFLNAILLENLIGYFTGNQSINSPVYWGVKSVVIISYFAALYIFNRKFIIRQTHDMNVH